MKKIFESFEDYLENVNEANTKVTEKRFRDFFDGLPSGRGNIYTIDRIVDNWMNLSYHLTLLQKKIQYNFWLNKPKGIATISISNNIEKFEEDKLKTILRTSDFNEFEDMVLKLVE